MGVANDGSVRKFERGVLFHEWASLKYVGNEGGEKLAKMLTC